MNAYVECAALQNVLKTVGVAVGRRPTLPVLATVLVEAVGASLRLSATNLEAYMEAEVTAKVTQEGAVCVHHRLLSDLIGAYPGGRIELQADKTAPRDARGPTVPWECEGLNVTGGQGHTSLLHVMDPLEFPWPPIIKDTEEPTIQILIEPGILAEMIQETAYAAATEQSRPILTGVVFSGKAAQPEQDQPGYFAMAGADGFRLAMTRFETRSLETDFQVIVPAQHISELLRWLGQEIHPVSITIGESQIFFELTGSEKMYGPTMAMQLIDGKPPDYGKLMPPELDTEVVIDRSALLAAFRAANVIARLEAHAVRVQMLPAEGLILMAKSADIGNTEVAVTLEDGGAPTVSGVGGEFATNAGFIIDALAATEAQTVRMGMTTPKNPVFIGADLEKHSYKTVIMPMVVR